MEKLLNQIGENLSFIGMCVLIIGALWGVAKLSQRWLPKIHRVSPARRISIIAICAAIAAILHMLDFPLLFLAPEFYKLDFSELPVLLCGFYLGPAATVAFEADKILLKLLLKGTDAQRAWRLRGCIPRRGRTEQGRGDGTEQHGPRAGRAISHQAPR